MGWSSGSELFSNVIAAARHRMADKERKAFYLEIIPAFEAQDWDTQDECLDNDPMFKAAYREHSRRSR